MTALDQDALLSCYRSGQMSAAQFQRHCEDDPELAKMVEEAGREPSDAAVWRHKKRGSTYTIVGEAELQAEEPLSEGHILTIYRCRETGKLWARNAPEFHDGRFELITACEQKS